MTNETILNKLNDNFGGRISGIEEPYGLFTFAVAADMNIQVLKYLKD